MSTGLECHVIQLTTQHEFKDLKVTLEVGWYYMLQNWSCPVGGNWTDDATTYGPFRTQEVALEHLHNNHANPGGWYSIQDPCEEYRRVMALNF